MLDELLAQRAMAADSKKKAKAAASAAATAGIGAASVISTSSSSSSGSSGGNCGGPAGPHPAEARLGKAPARASADPAMGAMPPPPAPSGSKRPRSEWEVAIAEREQGSAVYKSLFISKADRKKQEEQEAANFCARGIVPSLSRSKFGLG